MSNWVEKVSTGDLNCWSACKISDGVGLVGIGNDGSIHKTSDHGVTWTEEQAFTATDSDAKNPYSLIHVDGDICLAGVGDNGSIWKSTDAGETWTQIIQLADNYSFAYDNFGGTSFVLGEAVTWDAGASGGTVIACDNGTPTGTMTINVTAGSLADDDSISAAGSGGSCDVDGAATQTTATNVHALACANPDGASSIIVCGTNGDASLFRSVDAGDTWVACTTENITDETIVYTIETVYEHATTGVLVLGTYNNAEIYRSTDSGDTWSSVQDIADETSAYVACVMKQGASDGVVLMGTQSASAEIWRSTDSGANWMRITALAGAETTPIRVYEIIKVSENVALALTYDSSADLCGQTFKTVDQGLTWTEIYGDHTKAPISSDSRIMKGVCLGDNYIVAGGTEAKIFLWQWTGAPGDALGWKVPDNAEVLSTKPQAAISFAPQRQQRVTVFDDGSEERVSFSQKNYYFADLTWKTVTTTVAGTIMDFWNSPDKGDGKAKTFLWSHPTDGYVYTVRIETVTVRHLMSDHFNIVMRLKLLGLYYES